MYTGLIHLNFCSSRYQPNFCERFVSAISISQALSSAAEEEHELESVVKRTITMSLVDYASSSEDEELGEDDEHHHDKQDRKEERRVEKERPRETAAAETVPPLFHGSLQKSSSPSSTYRHPDVVVPSNAPSMEKLPDASILLSSPSFWPQQQYGGNGHSSHIASSIAETASKKRERNGSAFVHPSNKNPRGNPLHLRSISDTHSSTFIPPQLKGRSNVVTEDLRKLFVNRNTEPSG